MKKALNQAPRFYRLMGEMLLDWAALAFAVFALVPVCVFFISYSRPYARGAIVRGITIDGVPVSGLTHETALDKLKEHFNYRPGVLFIKILDHKEKIDLAGLRNLPALDPIVQRAEMVGRDHEWRRNLDICLNGTPEKINFTVESIYDVSKLKPLFEKLSKTARRSPENARLDVPHKRVIPHKAGYELDVKASLEFMKVMLPGYSGGLVVPPLKEILPDITTDAFKGIDFNNPLSTFTTKYNSGVVNRSSNLALATSFISGTELKPGEVFSFNGKVGERNSAAGFKLAPVINMGRLEPGMGGGVCQVSGTLYNAVLLADLEVVERHNHTLASSYVPLGQDATVVYPVLDFKFKNSLDAPIYIYGEASKGLLTFSFFTTVKHDYKIKVWHTTDRVIPYQEKTVPDPRLKPGEKIVDQKGIRGFEATTFVERIYSDGKKEKVKSYHDVYRGAAKITRVGPAAAPPPAPPGDI